MAFDVQAILDKYNAGHQHPVNRALHTVGIPMIGASILLFPLNPLLAGTMFVVGWILQFIGHAFEGKAPMFLSDPRAFLIAPVWYAKKLFGRA
jgi:uncharacterized membrane protein YGL010W